MYRVEKVGKYLQSLAKKSIFKFFDRQILMFAQKKTHASEMMSDQIGIRFKMWPIVKLTKLGGQNFKLHLYSENFRKIIYLLNVMARHATSLCFLTFL